MRMREVSRSIGVQVALCNCSCQLNLDRRLDSTVASRGIRSNSSRMTSTARRDPEAAPLCELESYRMSSSSSQPVVSEDQVDRCSGNTDLDETKQLLREDEEVVKRKSQSRPGSTSSPTYPSGLSHELRRQVSATRTSSNDSMSNVKRDSASSHHSYHFRRKLANFRSDSVFSDVMPTSSSSSSHPDPRKDSDSSEKAGGGSGSLTSLKPKESKWVALRKKLKINSSTTGTSKKSDEKEKSETITPLKTVSTKRSLFQRAKTLAILPVAKVKNDTGEESRTERHRHRKNQHVVQEPKELFNVGGEMNMIPLEFLIDINDLNLDSK